MSFESILTIDKSIDLRTQNEIIFCFENNKLFRAIKKEIVDEKSLDTYYAYFETNRKSRPEDFYISLTHNEVYLCFYSATTEQQIQITSLLTECLHKFGILGEFDEP